MLKACTRHIFAIIMHFIYKTALHFDIYVKIIHIVLLMLTLLQHLPNSLTLYQASAANTVFGSFHPCRSIYATAAKYHPSNKNYIFFLKLKFAFATFFLSLASFSISSLLI